MSLEGMHGTVEVPAAPGRFLEAVAGVCRAGILVSVGYMDPGNWGTDLQAGAQFKYGLLWVVGLASLMAIFHAGHLRAPGRGDGQGPGPMLPRLVSGVDALAELAAVRGRDWRVRSGGSAGQRRGAQPDVPYPAALGGHHHRRWMCCLLLALQRFGMRTIEAVVLVLVATIGVCYFIEIFVLPQTAAQFSGDGTGAGHAGLSSAGNDLCGDRHHRRDGHAAQSLSAFGAGAEPQAARKTSTPSDSAIRFNTIDSTWR